MYSTGNALLEDFPNILLLHSYNYELHPSVTGLLQCVCIFDCLYGIRVSSRKEKTVKHVIMNTQSIQP